MTKIMSILFKCATGDWNYVSCVRTLNSAVPDTFFLKCMENNPISMCYDVK